MEKVFENDFTTTYFDAEKALIKNVWKEESANLTEVSFKETLLQLKQVVLSHNTKKMMLDTRLFKFLIEPRLQEWVATNVTSLYARNGLQKVATILPSSIFERVSLQQTVDENLGGIQFQRAYFDDESSARKWLFI